MALSLCQGDLGLQFTLLWLPQPCIQKHLSKYAGIRWCGYPWKGPVEGVWGLLVLFLPLYPLLANISCIRSWFWERTCYRISVVPVELGGSGYWGGGHCLPYLPYFEIWQKYGLGCLQQGWIVYSQIFLGSILRYWWVLNGIHKNVSW